MECEGALNCESTILRSANIDVNSGEERPHVHPRTRARGLGIIARAALDHHLRKATLVVPDIVQVANRVSTVGLVEKKTALKIGRRPVV